MVLVREFERYYGPKPLEVDAFDKMPNFEALDSQFLILSGGLLKARRKNQKTE